MAVQKGQLSQSVQSRLSCCRVLGKIATKFDPFVYVQKQFCVVTNFLYKRITVEMACGSI